MTISLVPETITFDPESERRRPKARTQRGLRLRPLNLPASSVAFTYIIVGLPDYNYSIVGPKTLF